MKRLALVLAATCFLHLALVQPVCAKDNWTSIRSKNFFLVGNGSEKDIRQVATRLEQFREVFTYLFPGITFNTAVPTTVIVFKSESSYRPFKPNPNIAGYFQPGNDVNYIALTTDLASTQDPFNVIFHEYTHLLVKNTLGNVPVWFNEGLAEYYSMFAIEQDRKVTLGKPIGHHVYLLRDEKMLPLKTLFQVDQKSPYYNERNKQSIFYAESWALIHYLILGNGGKNMTGLSRFINSMAANMPMDQAFEQAFQTTFQKMEKELREYIGKDRYPVVSGHFEHKLEVDSEMQTEPLTEAEGLAYLGDLLLHLNGKESEVYLQKALKLDPNLAMAHASMGMLRVKEGKIDEARTSLERAAQNSQNYLIHYYYAFALSREGMNDTQVVNGYAPETVAKIREQLKQAIALRPDYPESYNLLVFVNMVTGTQLDESIQLLKHVLAIEPGRNDALFNLAQIYLQKQDYKNAREILEKLSKNTGDTQVRERAQGLLDQLKARDEQLARFNEKQAARNSGAAPREAPEAGTDTPVGIAPQDPSAYLREALRKPEAGEKQVQGVLTRVDCDKKGMTFVIQLDARVLRLRAESFEAIDIVAFTTDAGNEISCGPRKAENPVVVCYLPSSDAGTKIDGQVKSIEFVPRDFKLNP